MAAPLLTPATAAAIVVALTVARVLALLANSTDLYFDEAQYWVWSTTPDWGYYSKPPLIAWVIALTTGLFGHEEWAVRLAAPILHAVTALVLLRLGTVLYGGAVGAVAAILFATLPAVSLSSTLITTDVPLLAAWSVGLLAGWRLLETDRFGPAIGFGLAVAVGMNAKYAMAFMPALLLLAVVIDPARRALLVSPRLWTGLALGLTGLLPNLVWQARNGFVTLLHTRDNAHWSGSLFHPGSMLEFVGAQFGVFGPLLFGTLVVAAFGRWRSDRPAADRYLLVLSVPILLVFTVQGLLSRANANWAATAYPAATVLVAALLLSPDRTRRRLLRLSVVLHGLVAAVFLVAPVMAPAIVLPNGRLAFERVLGWREMAEAVAATAAATGARTLIVDRRADAAALLYYLRDQPFSIVVPRVAGRPPQDHFEMTRPFRLDSPSPGLLVHPEGDRMTVPPTRPIGSPVPVPVSRGVTRERTMVLEPVAW